MVLLPGGPKSKTPFGGALNPVKRSGLRVGYMTASFNVAFAKLNPAISSHVTPGDYRVEDTTNHSINQTSKTFV